jgi:hypothetical protein
MARAYASVSANPSRRLVVGSQLSADRARLTSGHRYPGPVPPPRLSLPVKRTASPPARWAIVSASALIEIGLGLPTL